MNKFGEIKERDEVQITEGRFAGYYAIVVECNGIEALVEFPDKRRAVVSIDALALVLRPANGGAG